MHTRKRKPLTQLPASAENINGKRRKSYLDESSPSFAKDLNVRAGSVLRMILKNFMCHSHLEVTFNSNINYVIGRNGSGKSAILTALVVGLGGKATLTNRGNSVKGFIKTGKNSASVEITLSNKGPLAYKHKTFGNEIIIERTFRSTGSGNYKIKSISGEVISTQAKEVHQICLSLNIQIDNPVCLLNQDTSRNFLNTKDTHQKFLLFMKATRLEELLEEYRKVVDNKKCAARALLEKESSYNELENEIKGLKDKIINHQNIAKLKARVNELQKELSWAKVRDAENDLQKNEVVVDKIENEVEIIQNQLQNEQQVHATSNATIQSLEQQIAELHGSIESQNAPQNILVQSLGELKEEIVTKTRESQVVQKSIALETGNCNILEREIQQITQNFSQLEQEKIKRIEDINAVEKKIQDVESLMETSKNDQFQMRNSVQQLQEQERNLRSELDQVTGQVENNKYRISSLKEQSSNALSLYGRDMVKVVETIKTYKNKFQKMPRGPLGNYIKLKDKKWAVAVEGFLGPALLRAFIVDNKSDGQILMKIFENVCTGQNKPMVITSKFYDVVHDVRSNLVAPIDGCLSVYSVLEISDPVVANCLIDQSGLEGMLLIPSTDKAIELLSDKRRVPRNCKQGITITGDKYYPDPNYKTYASRYHRAQFLQVSVQDMIRQLEEQSQVLEDKKESVSNQYNSIRVESQAQLKNLRDLQNKVSKLVAALSRLRRQCDDLKNVAEPDVASVHTMETELSELKVKIEERKVVATKILEDIAKVKCRVDKKDEKLNELKAIVRGYEERMETLNEQLNEHVGKCREYEINRRFAARRLDDSKKRLCSAKDVLTKQQRVVDNFTQDASATGDRPDILRQVNVIMDQLKQDQRTIRSIESDMEDIEEVSEKYRNCKDRIKKIKEIMVIMIKDVKDLQLAIEKRNRYYHNTEEYFITFVKHSFQKVLEFRQFKGSLEINMDSKSLEMIVIPQQGSQGLTTTSNLSGGERSFSTVAFLYSLWQCMEFPFYFLDEFDVFMDKVNRSKVMEILVYHAKSRPDLQFVFLTPQDVSFVNDKSIAIHKLSDPERNVQND